MKTVTVIGCLVLLFALAACGPSPVATALPTPVPTSLPTPVPSLLPIATAFPIAAPAAVEDYVPTDVPRCQGLKALDKAITFAWAGIEEMNTENGNWYYYHCDEKVGDLAGFYRAKLTKPPYNWLETGWVERPQEGTLGIYFHTARQIWNYIWFLPDTSSKAGSHLVISEQMEAQPDLPCCH
jgi:hypothetical protein